MEVKKGKESRTRDRMGPLEGDEEGVQMKVIGLLRRRKNLF